MITFQMKKLFDFLSFVISPFFFRYKNKNRDLYVYFLYWGLGDVVIIADFLKKNIELNVDKKHVALVSKNSKEFVKSEFNFDNVIQLSPPWVSKKYKYRLIKGNYYSFFKDLLDSNLSNSETIYSIRNDPRDAFIAKVLKSNSIISTSKKGGYKFIDIDLNLSENFNRYDWNVFLFKELLNEQYDLKKIEIPYKPTYVLIHTGSTELSKKFHINEITKVIDSLLEKIEVKIICEDIEFDYFENKYKNLNTYKISQLDFSSFSKLLKDSSAVFCNDSGPMHLANYYNKKTFVVWGSTDPKIWATPNTFNFVDEKITCRPCKGRCINGKKFNHFGKIDSEQISKSIKEYITLING